MHKMTIITFRITIPQFKHQPLSNLSIWFQLQIHPININHRVMYNAYGKRKNNHNAKDSATIENISKGVISWLKFLIAWNAWTIWAKLFNNNNMISKLYICQS